MANVNLLSSSALVQTPYITVKIGKYEFGCYNEKAVGSKKYPNYIKSLQIEKINGQVNKYMLQINYVITEQDDPNYFEKVFSSVSDTRRIVFTYGDLSNSNYLYREEEAIITNINSSFSVESSSISYTVNAVSSGILAKSGAYPFIAPQEKVKPSDEIKKLLKNKMYGLQDLFTGMRDMDLVNRYLIPGNDLAVQLESKLNYSVLEYLQYLVSCMTPDLNSSVSKNTFYVMNFIDDTSGIFGGPYFKITPVDKRQQYPEAYDLYIGYPTANAVTSFRVQNNENYSIYYNYQNELHPEKYVRRINTLGEWEDIYAPVVSSGTDTFETDENDRTWWTKITQYPINISLDIRGLLRPAILMSYVRLYVLFFGRLHINSGIYIVTKQVDNIDESGYRTSLNLTRISSDESMEIL